MSLLEELKQNYPSKVVEPFGNCIIVPAREFKEEWKGRLESEGVKISVQAYRGEASFFLRARKEPTQTEADDKPETHRKKKSQKIWSNEEETQLRELYFQGLTAKEIAQKLGRTYCSIAQKILRMPWKRTEPEVSVSPLKWQPNKPKPEPQTEPKQDATSASPASPDLRDDLVKEFLSAASLLYPSHRKAAAHLLKECSAQILKEEA